MTTTSAQTFKVPSSSTPGFNYDVVFVNGRLTCNCRGFRASKKAECRHTKQIAGQLGLDPVPAPLPVQESLLGQPEGFIPPMAASALKEGATIDHFSSPDWCMEEKFDGHRMILVISDEISMWSRQGNLRAIPRQILTKAQQLPVGVFDGELIVPGGTSSDVTMIENQDRLTLVLFDILRVLRDREVFVTTGLSYTARRSLLEFATSDLRGPGIEMAPNFPVSRTVLQDLWKSGREGVIVKRRDSIYQEGKRSKEWVKFKKKESAVLTITGFEEGELGPHSVILLRHDDGTEARCKALNDRWRAAFAVNSGAAYVGRRLVIEHQGRTTGNKFRHPMADHFEDGEP